ncbi:MAG: protein-disulfide reductase DsbD domain-containing protein [Pseudomonadota bacterium]
MAQGLIDDDVLQVEVLTGWREPGMTHIAALRLTLDNGWKTYWRAPGDAGIPPNFDWSGSSNVASVTPHWPVPDIFNQNGMRSIGYDGEVIIPLHVTRQQADAPIRLTADIDIGVCEEICIPARISIDAPLPVQGAPNGEIASALDDRPMTEQEARVGQVVCVVTPLKDGIALEVHAEMPSIARGEVAAIETADPTVWVAEPEMSRDGNTLIAKTELVRYDAEPFALDRSGVRMTVFGSGVAVDIQGCTGG